MKKQHKKNCTFETCTNIARGKHGLCAKHHQLTYNEILTSTNRKRPLDGQDTTKLSVSISTLKNQLDAVVREKQRLAVQETVLKEKIRIMEISTLPPNSNTLPVTSYNNNNNNNNTNNDDAITADKEGGGEGGVGTPSILFTSNIGTSNKDNIIINNEDAVNYDGFEVIHPNEAEDPAVSLQAPPVDPPVHGVAQVAPVVVPLAAEPHRQVRFAAALAHCFDQPQAVP